MLLDMAFSFTSHHRTAMTFGLGGGQIVGIGGGGRIRGLRGGGRGKGREGRRYTSDIGMANGMTVDRIPRILWSLVGTWTR